MASAIVTTLVVIGIILFIIGMAVYWAVPTEYMINGIIETGSSVGLILIVIGAILISLGCFLVDV